MKQIQGFSRATGPARPRPRPIPLSHGGPGVAMGFPEKDRFQLATDDFLAVYLFLNWYLRRDNLEKSKAVQKQLAEMDEGRVRDAGKWADRLRKDILRAALITLGTFLERRINQVEILYLNERIEDFIQLYAMGLKA